MLVEGATVYNLCKVHPAIHCISHHFFVITQCSMVISRPVARHGQTRAVPGLPLILPGLPCLLMILKMPFMNN